MSINSQNTELANYNTELWSIFWKKFSVILESIKEKTSATLNMKLSNWIWSRKYSQVKLSKNYKLRFLIWMRFFL